MAYRRKQKNRVRSVPEIEARLKECRERQEKARQLEERNKKFFEKERQYCSDYWRRRDLIFEDPANYKKVLGMIRTKELKESARRRVDNLERLF